MSSLPSRIAILAVFSGLLAPRLTAQGPARPFVVTCTCFHQEQRLTSQFRWLPDSGSCGSSCRFTRAIVVGDSWEVTEGSMAGRGSWSFRTITKHGGVFVFHWVSSNRYNVYDPPRMAQRWSFSAPIFSWQQMGGVGISGPFTVGVMDEPWRLPPWLQSIDGCPPQNPPTAGAPMSCAISVNFITHDEALRLVAPTFTAGASITDSRLNAPHSPTDRDFEYTMPFRGNELKMIAERHMEPRPSVRRHCVIATLIGAGLASLRRRCPRV
jgi:hypothetical protein